MSDAPATDSHAPDNQIGLRATLDDARSVALFEQPRGTFALEFVNGERVTRIHISADALDAVVALALQRLAA